MIQAHISYTVRTPHPTSTWTLVHEEMKRFADIDEVKAYLGDMYFYCKKRVPCYQDTQSRGVIQTGWIYCYKEKEDNKTWYRQDWISLADVEARAVDVRHARTGA